MSAETAIKHLHFPVARLVEDGAAAIVDGQNAHALAVRDAVVLVPHLRAVSPVARALSAATAPPVLLLPRITTLTAWAQSVTLQQRVATFNSRVVTLYEALAAREWLRNADLWAMASELAGLFDEMIRYKIPLAENLDDFTAKLEHAYRAQSSSALRFEAQLVHELWWAMMRDNAELAPEAAYQLRLARLAEQASCPLYALGLTRAAPAERAFFERYAESASVMLIDAYAQADALDATLTAAWPDSDDGDLRQRAQRLRAAHPRSALRERVRIFGAVSAEQEAQAIDVIVREWCLAGKSSIAVIVQDRVVARRARALLERAGVLVSDEAGWALSTTSAATVLGRWLDIAVNDAYHQDLLDLLKSPFAFHDIARDQRRESVWRLERWVREANVIVGIHRYAELARRHGDAEVLDMVLRVQRGLNTLTRQRKTAADWLAALRASLAHIGVVAGLEADPAGEQLLDLLADLARDIGGNQMLFSFAQWRRWLANALETATFHDRGVQSPVVFTYLEAMALRRFDAVLVCGCDAQHLPGPEPLARIFNQGVRADLGLPTHIDELREMEREWSAVIASNAQTMFTWQRQLYDEANLFSPLLARLVTLHQLAYGDALADDELAARLTDSAVHSPRDIALPAVAQLPRPFAPADLVPAELSPSSYNTLIACPYQFYARYLLKLGELDTVQELIGKRDYGSYLHAVLAKFHRLFPIVSEATVDTAQRALIELSESAFKTAVADNYLARAWLLQWKALIPQYVSWQRRREAAGWRWHVGETKCRITIVTPQGRELKLVGRLDRVDQDASGRVELIDYKTSRAEILNDKLKIPGEDVQLPLYALMWGGAVAQAFFLALERADIKSIPADNIDELMGAERERVALMYDMLGTEAALPANGLDAVCAFCEARGLCRKDYWS